MRKGWIYVIQIALSLVIVIGLAIGCGIPSASKYPADINGHVTIAEFLSKRGADFTPSENEVFWVVDISVKNNAYEQAVTGDYEDWRIAAGGEVYWIPELLKLDKPSSLNVPVGQTGQIMICFSVPRSLTLSDAQIRYQGQEPYSHGKLTGGDKVAGYDWGLKTVVTGQVESISTPEVTLDKIYLKVPSSLDERRIRMWREDDREKAYIGVRMFPNDKTIPNQIYTVNLFYKNELVDRGIVFWEPNAFLRSDITGKIYYEDKAKILPFPIPKDHELYQEYFSQIYKPVSERHFNINDYVKVTITKK